MEKKVNNSSSRKPEVKKLIAVVSILGIILIVFGLYLSWPLIFGQTVVLATQPVDPVDLFRGQYLTIHYDISNIPSIQSATEGSTVYVSLTKDTDTGVWDYKSASLDKPTAGYFIAGEIDSLKGDTVHVNYGIEQYFFERNAVLSTRNMTVEVKIDDSGQARISKLLTNGKPLVINYTNR